MTSTGTALFPGGPEGRAASLRAGARRALPTGGTLATADLRRRHRWIVNLLWLHVLAVPLAAFAAAAPSWYVTASASVLLGLAVIASHERATLRSRALVATLGLVASSAILTDVAGGLLELHFHFFVVVLVVSLYQSWQPFLMAVGFVAAHHGVLGGLGVLDSALEDPAVLTAPLRWALTHGLFLAAQCLVALVIWRLSEHTLQRERTARRALERANLDLREAQALSGVGSWDWDRSAGTVWWSEQLYHLTGHDPASFTPTIATFVQSVHPEDRHRVTAILDDIGPDQDEIDFECRIVRTDGGVRVIHARGRGRLGVDGGLSRYLGTVQDITERKHLEGEIDRRALRDHLTGLGNRTLFFDRLEHALAVRDRTHAPLAVLFLDLDDFKTVNDGLGHAAGDALLVEVSRRLREASRASDTIARLGGDEFAVLLEGTDHSGAVQTARRIQEALSARFCISGREIRTTASIGIAVSAPELPADDLLRDADLAMYAVKRDGKGGIRVFEPAMLAAASRRIQLRSELETALELDQFVLHYQPVIDLDTGAVVAVEALLRWQHHEHGLVPPDDFIPLAEETGLITPIGAWVVREATRQATALQREFGMPLAVNVNLSSRQLQSDIVATVREALRTAQLPAHHLVLELTESCVTSDEEEVIDKLRELRDLGVRIAIDDFGTGYSSLSYLQRLPVDILKIDRAFVQCVTEGPEQSALAKAIIKLARMFDLETIGEGIETNEQAVVLQGFGSQLGQGFHLCRPLPITALREQLRCWDPTTVATMHPQVAQPVR